MSKNIPIYKKGKIIYYASVDDDMYDLLSSFKWHEANGYPLINISMHRLILKLKGIDIGDKVVDHIDCSRSNNTVSNLRLATKQQNGWNRKTSGRNASGFKGVRRMKNKWAAYCGHGKKQTQIGTFETAEDAAMAWDMHTRKIYGEFANCNFPIPSAEEMARIQAILDNPKKLKGGSKYLGVSPHQERWVASVYQNNKKIYAGIYDTEDQAALAFNSMMKELFGENAKQNKID